MIGKRTICKINGETVQTANLREVAELLIDIHGQHEHQSLLYKKNHLAILDAYAKEDISNLKVEVQEAFRIYRSLLKELQDADLDERERNKEITFLEYEIQEIQSANLKDNEDDILEDEYRRMVNGKKITDNLNETYDYTNHNISEQLNRAIRCMQDASRYDDKVMELLSQLSEIDNLMSDFNHELSSYSSTFEFSDEEFYEVENRLNEINRLKAKYGNSIADICVYCEKKEAELERLRNYETYVEDLKKQLSNAEKTLRSFSEQLSSLRQEAAKKLASIIREQLNDLNFLDVQFEIAFRELTEYGANGFDEVEFMISTNPGESVKPLSDVASGGELSRIMLAIKTVMADKDKIETLIFDEIDVGISGRCAQKVSEKMALIGKNHQVICITHLAQIAAMADSHFAIEKKIIDGKTQTQISLLNRQEEIEELARILGGAEITETVRKSAAEMKELARSTK
jgi:DNA repair protein RecN (Recombination protein N)